METDVRGVCGSISAAGYASLAIVLAGIAMLCQAPALHAAVVYETFLESRDIRFEESSEPSLSGSAPGVNGRVNVGEGRITSSGSATQGAGGGVGIRAFGSFTFDDVFFTNLDAPDIPGTANVQAMFRLDWTLDGPDTGTRVRYGAELNNVKSGEKFSHDPGGFDLTLLDVEVALDTQVSFTAFAELFVADNARAGPIRGDAVFEFVGFALPDGVVATSPSGPTPAIPVLPDRRDADGFAFEIEVEEGTRVFVDPPVATAYDYVVDDGPNFASVEVPAALPGGDDEFVLEVGGSSFTLDAGVEFDLLALNPLGFQSFRISGIDPAEALNPDDPLAFVTGLEFVTDGNVSLRQVPILSGTAQAPAPATMVLLACGLVLSLCNRRRRAST